MLVFAVGTGVLGLLVGSFLNVVIHRVPSGASVIRPRSACPQCDRQLTAGENIPVVSWLVQRGRCRGCATAIPIRYPLVELLTAGVFGVFVLRLGLVPELPAFLYLGAVGVALAAIDLDTRRLPNVIVLPSYVVGIVALTVAALASADSGGWEQLFRGGLGMAALFGLYFVLALAYPGGMGFGDVKLAGVLGLYLGWLGWAELVVGGFLGFFLGGVAGVLLMTVKGAGRKTRIPYGPFMLAGALLAVFVADPIAAWYLAQIGL